jgi:hypothetical protein
MRAIAYTGSRDRTARRLLSSRKFTNNHKVRSKSPARHQSPASKNMSAMIHIAIAIAEVQSAKVR